VKVSKSNVSLFQLQASVLGTKETESGLWATPNTMDYLPPRSAEGTKKLMEGHRKGRKKPSNLREQVDPVTMSMYPTPSASCQLDVVAPPETVEKNSSGWSVRRVGTGRKFGAKLNDVVNKLWPTPKARDHKDAAYQPTWKPSLEQNLPRTVLKNNTPGGRLNATFVEFLMGFPMNWTKLDPSESKPSETQSSHKSQESSDSQLRKFYPTPRANEPGRTTKGYGRGLAELVEGKEQREPKKFYRTPTAMDQGDNSFKYAAKVLKGKTNRSNSKQPVQKTLSMDVAMEHLKNNQHLIDAYDEKFKTRPQLPPKDKFLKYLKENLNKKKLIEDNIIKKTTIDHWFRSDHCFAYPTVEYWNMIKPYLKEIKYDYQMTFEIETDWE
jgi:hypothetical protein